MNAVKKLDAADEFEYDRKFVLSPKFCLHNKTIVLENKNGFVKFGLVRDEDEELKTRLEKAAAKEQLEAEFVKVDSNIFNKNFAKLFAVPDKTVLKSDNIDYVSGVSTIFTEKDKTETGKFQILQETILLLDSILNEARFKKATDIHVEDNCVRFRINGRLENFMNLESQKFLELIQRIKMLSKINIMSRNVFQDGQFLFNKESPVFVRVSVIPVVKGESVVLRLLDSKRIPLETEKLGFSQWQIARLDELEKCRNGLILICGPTGSGKSTTAASMLTEMNKKFSGSRKIITIEDPCEYILDGITQINLEKNGLDFENALKFIFRQDPDVIFIGEIRDALSARVALQASLTGHLVFATVHTSGFAETVMRLNDLGIPLNFLAQVLKGILLQELVFEKRLSGEETVKLDAKVLAVNAMAQDAILKGNDKVFLESTLKSLAI